MSVDGWERAVAVYLLEQARRKRAARFLDLICQKMFRRHVPIVQLITRFPGDQ